MKDKGFALILFAILLSLGSESSGGYLWYAGLLIGFVGIMLVFSDQKHDESRK